MPVLPQHLARAQSVSAAKVRSRQSGSRVKFDAAGLTERARSFILAQLAQNDGNVEQVVRYFSRTLRFARADVCRAMVVAAQEPQR